MEKDLIISCPECGCNQIKIDDKLLCMDRGCPAYQIKFDLDWKSK